MNNKNMKTVTAIDAVINNKLAECGVSPDALPPDLRGRLNARFLNALTETNVEREFLHLRTARRENQPERLTLREISDEEYRSFIEKAGYFPSEELIANVKARHAAHLEPSFLGTLWHEWGKNKAAEKKAAEASRHEALTPATNKSQSKTGKPQEKVDTSASVETRNVGVKNALPTTSPERRTAAPNVAVIPASLEQRNRGAISADPAPRDRTADAQNVSAKSTSSTASPENQSATPNGVSIPAPTGRQDRGSTSEEPGYRAHPDSIEGLRDIRSCTYRDTPPQSVSSSSLGRTSNDPSSAASDKPSVAPDIHALKKDGNAAASPGASGGPPFKPLAGGKNASASTVTPKDAPASASVKSAQTNNGGALL